MKIKIWLERYSRINIILLVLFLLGFATLYFLYYRARSQAEIFVSVALTRQNVPAASLLPYWIADSILVGDREVNPLGGVAAEVLDKQTYEGGTYGQFVYLLLRVKAIKDRSGIYLFKNKPLSAGGVIELKLIKAQVQGLVTYVGEETPKYEYKKLKVRVKVKNVEPWMADSLEIGSSIKDNKEEEIAKVLEKKVSPAEVRVDTAQGLAAISYDKTKRDLEATIEVLVKKIDDSYYFAETQKVKVNEKLFLPFDKVVIEFPIISIEEIK